MTCKIRSRRLKYKSLPSKDLVYERKYIIILHFSILIIYCSFQKGEFMSHRIKVSHSFLLSMWLSLTYSLCLLTLSFNVICVHWVHTCINKTILQIFWSVVSHHIIMWYICNMNRCIVIVWINFTFKQSC